LALSANTATPLVLANAQPVQVSYSFSQGDSTGLNCSTSDANVPHKFYPLRAGPR
jgi:hypothetical protein